jgi:hypothetical protein
MYLPHLNINSNPTPSTSTTNSTTYIKPSSPSYTIDTAFRHNTRLINKNKELQDTLTKGRKYYKTLKQQKSHLEQIIYTFLPHPIFFYKEILEDDNHPWNPNK